MTTPDGRPAPDSVRELAFVDRLLSLGDFE
jgi:hypothetical protein